MRVFSTSYVRRALGIVALPVIALPLTSSVAGAARTHVGTQTQVIVSHDVHHDTSPALRSLHPAHNAAQAPHVVRQGRHAAPSTSHRFAAPDTSGRRHSALNIPSASQNFEGITDLDGVIPPDNDGAVGTSQYVELVNSHLAVYTKAGATVLGPETTNTLFSGFGGGCQSNNDGDGTILFDTISQRWVIQQFSVTTTPYLDCVAVSTSSDATGTWNRYSFQFSNFPDYPKTGVWPDAYYATFNLFNSAGTQGLGSEVCAFNRASMLTGAAAASQCVMATASGETTLLPATIDGTTQPAAGTPEWLVAISPTAANSLAYWRYAVDWTTPSNSSLSAATNLGVAGFSEACGGAGTCVPQAGTSQRLDSLGDRLMFRLQYRNFGGYEALVVTHAITAGSSVGMRWYELRTSGSALTVYQQGTYAPDSTYRWMGSIAMDKSGDMALGYSTSSSSLHPGIAYTGRLISDALGSMPQGESTLFTGAGSQTAGFGVPGNRWGDYSEMTVDPTDDCTFWYVNEYIPSNGNFNWHTRIGSFKFPSCGGTTPDDFSISANPASLTLAQGANGSSTISTAVTSGSAQTVSLALSGAPSGATATLNPTSVTAGNSSTLAVNVGTASPGSYTLTITGTGSSTGSPQHSATVGLTVTSSGGGVFNGGFETGDLSGWAAGGVFPPTVAGGQPHSGSFAAQLGASSGGEPNGDSSLTQTITVPTGGSTLSFWYWASTTDSITWDWQEAQIRNTSGTTLAQVFKVCSNAHAWTHVTFNLSPYAGQTVQLYFNDHQDGYGDLTYMYLDDVAVTTVANDFSIAANPSSLSITQGSSGTSTMSTAVTSGTAQPVALSASGLPSGATASFNPASVSSGGSSTLTIATAASTPTGTSTVTVTGTGTSATHSTTVSLTVTAPSSNPVVNGGFEAGNLSGWATSGASAPTVSTAQHHGGSYSAVLGAATGGEPNGNSSLTQTIIVPSGATTLSFYYWAASSDSIRYDWQEAQIRNTSGTSLAQVFKVCSNTRTWTHVTFNISAYRGQTIQLYFNDHMDGYGDLTWMYLDDVTVQ